MNVNSNKITIFLLGVICFSHRMMPSCLNQQELVGCTSPHNAVHSALCCAKELWKEHYKFMNHAYYYTHMASIGLLICCALWCKRAHFNADQSAVHVCVNTCMMCMVVVLLLSILPLTPLLYIDHLYIGRPVYIKWNTEAFMWCQVKPILQAIPSYSWLTFWFPFPTVRYLKIQQNVSEIFIKFTF